MAANGGKADMGGLPILVAIDPSQDMGVISCCSSEGGFTFYPDKSEYASGIRQSLPQSKCSSCCQQVTPFLRGIL